MSLWNRQSQFVNQILSDKGHTLAHCDDGSGPSGMILIRLMYEVDELPDYALERLCAMLLLYFLQLNSGRRNTGQHRALISFNCNG